MLRILLAAVLAWTPSSDLFAQRLNQEVEVDQGYYMTLVYSHQGWRVWKIETREGSECTAIKSVIGQPHPRPAGDWDRFEGGTPFVRISNGYKHEVSVDVRGYFGYHGRWRTSGSKFWNEKLVFQDLLANAEKRIEVNSETYEYDQLKVGRVEESGVLDLVGFGAAIDALKACDPVIVFPAEVDRSRPRIRQGGIPSLFPTGEMIRLGLQGKVGFSVAVDAVGRPTKCVITSPATSQVLNDATCPSVMKMTFDPAVDKNGMPVAGVFESAIRWNQEPEAERPGRNCEASGSTHPNAHTADDERTGDGC